MTRAPRTILVGLCLLLIIAVGSLGHVVAQQVFGHRPAISTATLDLGEGADEAAVRFVAIDLLIDPNNQPLAAWQIDLAATRGQIEIVGISGGEHPAYHNPPYYDPRAIQQERVIIAAFSTANPSELPATPGRVATINVMITGTAPTHIEARLTAAADFNCQRLPATLTLRKGTAE